MVEILGKGESEFSNFRYFLKEGYNGLIIDHDNQSQGAINHWVIKENIIPILRTYRCPKSFDALSIDLNGNDYWVLEEVLSHYKPKLVVAEFNPSKQGSAAIQYSSSFLWGKDDYYGFTFEAGKKLAEKYGYYIIFQNDELNLYMVAQDCVNVEGMREVTYERKICFPHNPEGIWINI